MKKMMFKKINDHNKRVKTVFVNSSTEDQECKTDMRKSFVYKVAKTEKVDLDLQAPQVYIQKAFDTKKRTESFSLRVEGRFYMKHKGFLLEVKFRHTLNIDIQWKTKIFSPKKSKVLT